MSQNSSQLSIAASLIPRLSDWIGKGERKVGYSPINYILEWNSNLPQNLCIYSYLCILQIDKVMEEAPS